MKSVGQLRTLQMFNGRLEFEFESFFWRKAFSESLRDIFNGKNLFSDKNDLNIY